MPSTPYTPMLLDRLKNDDYAMNYLTEVLKHETQEAFFIALWNVIEAREKCVAVEKFDLMRGELIRDIIDLKELESLSSEDLDDLSSRINSKIVELESNIKSMLNIYSSMKDDGKLSNKELKDLKKLKLDKNEKV